ncbi:hypothetical protein, partial [Acinetobacter proteolyticus]|uniref:hypothetical protein n=1 Tax=Acinetobacter proteolyticus TaxID=1776741 RepID=UPI003B97FDEE
VTATATDPAGNTSLPGTGTVSTDVTAPIVTVDDDLSNDATPALTGTVNDPTATIVVNVDGVDYPAVNNGDSDLPEWHHSSSANGSSHRYVDSTKSR